MDQSSSIDRIRGARFAIARKGYDKREVERFLDKMADWLETGGGDQARATTFRRELEKVGERTGEILAAAHDAAEEMRAEAQREATQTLKTSREETELKRTESDRYSHEARTGADRYAAEARAAADGYSEKTRTDSDEYGTEVRAAADRDSEAIENKSRERARETVDAAQAEAERIIAEGRKRRADIEAVITDLVSRRDAVLTDVDRLTGELRSALDRHPESPGRAAEAAATQRSSKTKQAGSKSKQAGSKSEHNAANFPDCLISAWTAKGSSPPVSQQEKYPVSKPLFGQSMFVW